MPWITAAAVMVAVAAVLWFIAAFNDDDRRAVDFLMRSAAGLAASAAFTLLIGVLRAIETARDAWELVAR